MSKKNVCVLFGGLSCEHGVSCVSASYVAENLDAERYNVIKIGISREGKWYLFNGGTDEMREEKWLKDGLKRAVLSPDREDHGILVFEPDGGVSRIYVDVVFPVLHGLYGEDGTVQGLLELAGIPYVGPGVAASANGMDKVFSKIIFADAGLNQADFIYFDDVKQTPFCEIAQQVESKFTYPVFVKPANTGSSLGVSKVYNEEQLKAAVEQAAGIDRKVLIEETLSGHEIECAVMGNDDISASVLGEILPDSDFYDYDAKYVSETKTEYPAKLDPETTKKVQEAAVKAYRALGCKGLSRADFFVNDKGVYVNELNTIPGFTSISMYPQLRMYEGITYSQLLDQLIELASEANE